MGILKEFMPYIVPTLTAIISGAWSYMASKKKFKSELQIVNTNNVHEINKLMKQHEIEINNLKEKHLLELETKEKEYKHEKEMQELKTKNSIDERNQITIGNTMSAIVGDIFKDILTGKITSQDIEKISKQFPNQNN
ncbi:MAG: hypothetical protein PHR25_03350 [Clostridia bacterium]|nr:hypothetical protein [Clostridia bacterium]MDD4375797.1 hypothetical protein [Clostridia bacterium]